MQPPPLVRRLTLSLRPVLAALLVAAAACAPAGQLSAPTPAQAGALVYPGASWERIEDPASVGWSRMGLDSVRVALADLPSTGFMAVVGGRVLMEYGDLEAVSYLASVRKSILSMLFGNYVANGTVRLDRTLAEMGIDDVGGLAPAERQATVLDLLTARSGVYHEASNGGDDLASAPPRGSQRPGSYYLYSNWDFNALGTVFERETGRSIYDALESDLARPLGMQDFDRSIHRRTGDPSRSEHLAYHMNLSTRDMARIGHLMLREGSPHAAGPYRGAYTGLGAVGQHITVLPALDLVVAHKTRPGQERRVSHPEYLEVLDRLVRARCGARCR